MPPRAILDTLQKLWRTLEPLNLPMALMGGLALSAWKHVRATLDIDLLIGASTTSLQEILARAVAAGFRPKNSPPVRELGSFRIMQLEYEPEESFVDVQIDLLFADSSYHAEALARRIQIKLPDIDKELFVLSCEDLILHKLLAGRAIDIADVVQLLIANRLEVDVRYLRRWSHSLNLQDKLEDAWRTAFGCEALPE